MLTLRALSLNGAALPVPIEATFGEAGGTVGRADDNDLVLPDAERRISRLHARIVCKPGGFEMVDQGGNPIDVNGRPVGKGRTVVLADGDQVRIGGYVIGVVVTASPAPTGAARTAAALDDPFARPPARVAAHAAASRSSSSRPDAVADPLGLRLPSRLRAEPFVSPAAPGGAFGKADASPPWPAGGIPDDFDPFSDPLAARPAAASAPMPVDTDIALGGPGSFGQDIDDLFGLEPSSGADPFVGTPLAAPPAEAGTSPSATRDPLVAWGAAPPKPSAAPVPDHVTVLRGAYKPPRVGLETVPATAQSAPPATASTPAPNDIYLSWDETSSPGVAAPASGAAATPAMPMREPVPAPAGPAAFADAPRTAASAPGTRGNGETDDPLTRAFLAGLGTAAPPSLHVTPELMERIGALLREATQGTLDLLMARALTKREVRAEATLIVGKNNNPLKFSPDAASALAHLLSTHRSQGFLPPLAAMRDAFDDLRSHQFGFMAGLRAALAGVLKRFDPAALEKRLASKSMLDAVLSINRRARLWNLYEQLYRDIAGEAENDFHSLFGREFVRAYEEQVERLGKGGSDDGAPPA